MSQQQQQVPQSQQQQQEQPIQPVPVQPKQVLYYKDDQMINLVHIMADNIAKKRQSKRYKYYKTKTKKRRKKTAKMLYKDEIKKQYIINRISRFFPFYSLNTALNKDLVLPCGYSVGQSWNALKKCWKGYMLSKQADDKEIMYEYAKRIQKIEQELGIPTASFPNLGLLGDIFFLYDKDKERELRLQYYNDNIICDKNDVKYLSQILQQHYGSNPNITAPAGNGSGRFELVTLPDNAQGLGYEYTKSESRKFWHKTTIEEPESIIKAWMNGERSKRTEFIGIIDRKWNARQKEMDRLKELETLLKPYNKSKLKESGMERREVLEEKLLVESKLNSIDAANVVYTDDGWKFCREIVREKINTNIEKKKIRLHLCDEYGRFYSEDNPYTYEDWLNYSIMEEAKFQGYDIEMEKELLVLEDIDSGVLSKEKAIPTLQSVLSH